MRWMERGCPIGRRRGSGWFAPLAAVAVAAIIVAVVPAPGAGTRAAAAASSAHAEVAPALPHDPAARPNILLLVSDDQTWNTFGPDLMPNVYSFLVDRGLLFDRAYVNSSLCCPSRSQIMTGLYGQHTGVDGNTVALTRPTIVHALHDLGYRTGIAGKYLNSMPCDPLPQFDDWRCVSRPPSDYSLTDPWVNDNGTWMHYTGYQTDILANDVVDFIQSTPSGQPWFEMYTPTSPHLPANDARCQGSSVPPLREPSYYEDPTTDGKPAYMQRPPFTQQDAAATDQNHQIMTQAVTCLDTSIGTILDAVDSNPALEQNTLVVYLSDNGFLYGEHRRNAKIVPYEESVKVPFVVRAPMLHPEDQPEVSHALVQNIDIAPTIAELLSIHWGADGASLVPLLDGAALSVRDAARIEDCEGADYPCPSGPYTPGENDNEGVPSYFGLVTSQYAYVEYWTNEKELYDLQADPYEIVNLAGNPGYAQLQADLAAQLQAAEAPPPVDTTIVTGPPAGLDGRVTTFTYFSQDRRASYACRLTQDGAVVRDWFDCDGQAVTLGGLTDGSYIFEVAGTDSTGATDQTPDARSFSIASTGPDVEITSHPGDQQQASTLVFGFASHTTGVTFSCSIQPLGTTPTFAPCDPSSGATYGPLADGQWDFQVEATDPTSGQTTSLPAEWLTHVDNRGPQIVFDVPSDPSGILQSATTFTADFYPNEPVAGAPTCTLDGGSIDCAQMHVVAPGQSAGTHILAVTATDLIGNVGVTSYSFTVDTTPPIATITSGPAGLTNKASATFHFTANETATFQCSMDGAAAVFCSDHKTYNGLAEGPHTFCVTPSDTAGNLGSAVCQTFTVDLTGPTVTFASGPANPTKQKSATFTFTPSEPVSIYLCSLDAKVFKACSNPVTFAVKPGSHALSVKATDLAGNTGIASPTYAWTVDTTKPLVTITSKPPNPTNATTAMFAFTSNDLTATPSCTLGSKPVTCTGGQVTFSNLTAAKWKFTVKYTDPAGNVGQASYSWTIDLTAPIVTLTSTPPDPSPTTVSFGFSANEPASFTCSLDAGPATACSTGVTYSGLAPGLHAFTLTPTDAAGNVGLPAGFAWTVVGLGPPTPPRQIPARA